MIKVLVADDHSVVRRGLQQILTDEPDMVVAAEAVNAAEALEHARVADLDVVVLDISMPDRSGLEVLQEIRKECPGLPVLILSMYPEEQFAVRVMKAGAAGYLTKDAAPEELVGAIRKVVGGGKYVGQSLAERLALEVEEMHVQEPHEKLSHREFETMLMIASGKTPKEIAAEMSLSEKTVSTYRARLLDKMGMHNNAEIMRYAFEKHLVE